MLVFKTDLWLHLGGLAFERFLGRLSPCMLGDLRSSSLRSMDDADRTLVASAHYAGGTSHRAMATPSYATHYHLAERAPFLNLSDVSPGDLDDVLASLERDSRSVGSRRVFGRRYMELRHRTEARMRDLFVAAGGLPERASPHYFVLGSSRWFEGLATDMQQIVLELKRMPAAVTSCTYPDSFTSMGFGPDYGLPSEPKPYHGRVFSLADLPSLIARYGLPEDLPDQNYDGYEQRPFEKYVEVQLWSDEPVLVFLPQLR